MFSVLYHTIWAVQCTHVKCIESPIVTGSDNKGIVYTYADVQDGGTPLFVACQCNHLEVAEVLLSNGADIHTTMVDGATPLFISAQNGHLKMLKFLLGKGAKVNMARKVSHNVFHKLSH